LTFHLYPLFRNAVKANARSIVSQKNPNFPINSPDCLLLRFNRTVCHPQTSSRLRVLPQRTIKNLAFPRLSPFAFTRLPTADCRLPLFALTPPSPPCYSHIIAVAVRELRHMTEIAPFQIRFLGRKNHPPRVPPSNFLTFGGAFAAPKLPSSDARKNHDMRKNGDCQSLLSRMPVPAFSQRTRITRIVN
jgi:hypothetical protein